MQLSYTQNYAAAFAGMRVDTRNTVIESHASVDPTAIPFGTVLCWALGILGAVRAPRLNQGLVTISTDLIAANSTIVTVNGVSTTATVYAGSHNDTMAAILVKVKALSTVYNGSTTGDTMTIQTIDEDAAITWVTTLGSSQPTVTYAYTTIDTVAGVAEFEQKSGTLEGINSAVNDGGTGASGGVGFLVTQIVPTVRSGLNWCPVVVNVAAGEPAYAITAVTNRGKFTNSSSGNLKVGTFRTAGVAAGLGLAVVEIDIPALDLD